MDKKGGVIGNHYTCSVCGSSEHTKSRHEKSQSVNTYHHGRNSQRCSICGEIGHRKNWHRQDEVRNQTEKLCKCCNHVLPIASFQRNMHGHEDSNLVYINYRNICKKCSNSHRYKKVTIEDALVDRVVHTAYDAKRNNMGHSIDVFYVTELFQKQNGQCFYSGMEMTVSGSSAISIDRVDSGKEYTKDNVVLCCMVVNYMKNTYSIDDFIDICGKVWNHRGKS